jgi:hypothetical protein
MCCEIERIVSWTALLSAITYIVITIYLLGNQILQRRVCDNFSFPFIALLTFEKTDYAYKDQHGYRPAPRLLNEWPLGLDRIKQI